MPALNTHNPNKVNYLPYLVITRMSCNCKRRLAFCCGLGLPPNMRKNDLELQTAYAIQTPADNQQLYANWANSYDKSFANKMDYQLPAMMTAAYIAAGGIGPV